MKSLIAVDKDLILRCLHAVLFVSKAMPFSEISSIKI